MANMFDAITSPLGKASDLIKGLVEVRDLVKLGELQTKLQAEILSALQGATAAQTRQLEMGDEIRGLKDEIVKLQNWEAEQKRYVLTQLPPRVYVYSLKPEEARGEIPHQICKACYQNGKKSILDESETAQGIYHLKCTAKDCGVDLRVGHFSPSSRNTGGSWRSS